MSERDDAYAKTLGSEGGAQGPSDSPEPPPAGVLSGRYRLGKLLGTGGFGTVYEALDERIQKTVAVKILGGQRAHSEKDLERFRAEALNASKLSHPNIVAVTDFDLHDGRPFIVMEYAEGETLEEVLKREGPLSMARAARIAHTLALALAAAHEEDVVHRDLKPANIILREDAGGGPGLVKILDFGVAKLVDQRKSSSLTHTGQILGTPYYMAPEQVRDMGVLDGRADIYALGIMLYEMLTGTVPFADRAVSDVLVSKVVDTPTSPLAHNPEVPAGLAAIVMKAIEKKPSRRYRSAAEMARELEGFLRMSVTGDELALPPRRFPLILTAAAGLVVAAAVWAIWFRAERGGASPPPASSLGAPAPAPVEEATPVVTAPPDAAVEVVAEGLPDASPPEVAPEPADPKPASDRKRGRKRPRSGGKKKGSSLPDDPIEKIRLWR